MNEHEERVSQLLTAVAQREPATGPPVGDLITGGRLIERRKRRFTFSMVAASVTALAVGGTLIAQYRGEDRAAPSGNPGTWQRLPEAPLSPRANSIASWTGTEALFLGGQASGDCDETDCANAPLLYADGAAYNPATHSWRTLAAAPVGLSNQDSSAVIGDRVIVAGDDGLKPFCLMYDASEDAWTRLPSPPHAGPEAKLSSSNGVVYTMNPGEPALIYSLDPDGPGVWTSLPRRPVLGEIQSAQLLATNQGPAVIGLESPDVGDSQPVTIDVYRDGEWTRLSSPVETPEPWYSTGDRLIAPVPDLNHVANDAPGIGVDLSAGNKFFEVPEGPDIGGEGWPVRASSGQLVAANGFIFDDGTQRWLTTPLPDADSTGPAPIDGMAAVWADTTLITFGGFSTFHMGPNSRQVNYDDTTAQAWLLEPVARDDIPFEASDVVTVTDSSDAPIPPGY